MNPILSTESLFQLLLEITVRSTGMNDSTGQSLTALSCACLFSLVASWGETGRTLQAISAILTNNGSHACQTIQVFYIWICLEIYKIPSFRAVSFLFCSRDWIQDFLLSYIPSFSLFFIFSTVLPITELLRLGLNV